MGKYDVYTKYKVTIEDKVGIILFSDIPKNNLTLKMMEELTDILEQFRSDDDVRCVFFTHDGPDFSCGGGDDEQDYIDRGMSMEEVLQLFADLGGNLVKTLITYPKPTVVSGTGLAFGGAAALYECFDIRIASETFRLFDADAYWGMAGTWGMMTTHLSSQFAECS